MTVSGELGNETENGGGDNAACGKLAQYGFNAQIMVTPGGNQTRAKTGKLSVQW